MSLSTRSDLTSSSLSSSIVDIESGQGQDVCLDPPWVPVGVSTKLSVHAFSKGGLYFLTADVGYKEYEPATKTLAARTQASAGPTHTTRGRAHAHDTPRTLRQRAHSTMHLTKTHRSIRQYLHSAPSHAASRTSGRESLQTAST
jgi:hypothetical protein